MKRIATVLVAGAIAQVGVAAQQQTAGGAGRPSSRVTTPADNAPLTLRATLNGAYDDNTAADTSIGAPATSFGIFGGEYSAADAELTLRHTGRRFSFDGQGGSAVRYYPGVLDLTTTTHHAALRMEAGLGRSARLTLSQSARLAPQQTLSVFGVAGVIDPAAAAFDVAVTSADRLQTQSGATLDMDFTRHTTGTVTSGYGWQELADREWMRRYDVGGRLSHDLSSHFRIAGGYDHQTNESVVEAVSRVHDATMSFSYDKPLSPTRHLRIDGGAGATLLDQSGRRQYHATANARISRDIARSWMIGGSYARQYVYFDWLAQPVFANRFGVDVSGRLARRLALRLDGSYAGSQEIPSSPNAFDVYIASATVTYELTQMIGIDVAYNRFYYDFLNGIEIGPAAGSAATRDSVRCGLTLLMPLVRGSRERDAR